MQKESLVSIRVRTAAPAWLCIFHYVKLRVYKHIFKIKLWVFLHKLGSPCVDSLSLFLPLPISLFFRLIPWNTEACCVYLFSRASKTHARGSRRQAPVAYIDGASFLSWDFISFLCKPRNISLFSPLFFHYIILPQSLFKFLINLSLIADSIPASNFLDPLGLGPGNI